MCITSIYFHFVLIAYFVEKEVFYNAFKHLIVIIEKDY